MTGSPGCLAVEVDQGAKTMRFAPNDGHHQRQAKRACADEGGWRPTNSQLDGTLCLQWTREDPLFCERGTMLARPVDVDLVTQLQQQVELLFAGATGYQGAGVVAEFRARGAPVMAIVKDHSKAATLARLSELGATIAFVDAALLEPHTAALVDVSVAVMCLASSNMQVDSQSEFWAIDRDANIRFGLAALSAGARQIVLVATLDGRESRHFTEFSDAKEQAVDAIGDACRSAGIAFTVIHPTAYFSDLTNRVFDSMRKNGRYTVIEAGSHCINPVHGGDVAAFLAESVNDPGRAGREHKVGGPDIFTFREIGELAADVLGKRKTLQIRRVPLLSLRVTAMIAGAAGLVSRKSRRFTAVLRWMIYAGSHDAMAQSFGYRRLSDEFLAKADTLKGLALAAIGL